MILNKSVKKPLDVEYISNGYKNYRHINLYDNALDENFISIPKAECIRRVKVSNYEYAKCLIAEFQSNIGGF